MDDRFVCKPSDIKGLTIGACSCLGGIEALEFTWVLVTLCQARNAWEPVSATHMLSFFDLQRKRIEDYERTYKAALRRKRNYDDKLARWHIFSAFTLGLWALLAPLPVRPADEELPPRPAVTAFVDHWRGNDRALKTAIEQLLSRKLIVRVVDLDDVHYHATPELIRLATA